VHRASLLLGLNRRRPNRKEKHRQP
jgi:hypothetical protein